MVTLYSFEKMCPFFGSQFPHVTQGQFDWIIFRDLSSSNTLGDHEPRLFLLSSQPWKVWIVPKAVQRLFSHAVVSWGFWFRFRFGAQKCMESVMEQRPL